MDNTSLVITQTEEYISFVFDEDSLSTLEYKVLMNLEKGDFLSAYLMKQNGRQQLLYVIPGSSTRWKQSAVLWSQRCFSM